jgi:hypothetical protein
MRRGWRIAAVLTLVAALSAVASVPAGAETSAGGALGLVVSSDGGSVGVGPGPELSVGASVGWSYEVTNTGGVDLWALYVWQAGVGRADCPDRSLAPGESVVCSASSTVVAGSYAGGVYAWAWDTAGAEVAAEATAYYTGTNPVVVPAPAIDLETFVAGDDADAAPGPIVIPGSALQFRYEVHNTGNVELWGLWVHDDVLGTVSCPSRHLMPGDTVVCQVNATAAQGPHAASAVAQAWDATGGQVEDRDSHNYVGATAAPSVEIEALVEGFDGDTPPGPRVRQAGDTILFSYVVTNTGGVPLTDIQVRDDALGPVPCPGTTLGVGETMVCNASRVATLGQFASAGRVTASAAGVTVTDSDPIYYHIRTEPRINNLALEVAANGRDADDAASAPSVPVGASVRFTYTVTYTGNNIVYNVQILDPHIPASMISCTGNGTLQVGQTMRCTATVRAVAGPYSSLVSVVSWDADGRRVTAEDWVYYYGMA